MKLEDIIASVKMFCVAIDDLILSNDSKKLQRLFSNLNKVEVNQYDAIIFHLNDGVIFTVTIFLDNSVVIRSNCENDTETEIKLKYKEINRLTVYGEIYALKQEYIKD